jgi:hypothetical protein
MRTIADLPYPAAKAIYLSLNSGQFGRLPTPKLVTRREVEQSTTRQLCPPRRRRNDSN